MSRTLLPLGEPDEFRSWLEQESGERSLPAVEAATPTAAGSAEPERALMPETAAEPSQLKPADDSAESYHDTASEVHTEHPVHPVEPAGVLEQPSAPRSSMPPELW